MATTSAAEKDRKPVSVEVLRSEFIYEARLVSPAFDMLLGGRSFEPVYTALHPFGVKLEDMRVEGQQVTDQSLACYMLDTGTVVRYHFDHVEIRSSPQQIGVQKLFDLIEAAVSVVRGTSQSTIGRHAFTTGIHGRLRKGTFGDEIASRARTFASGRLTFSPSSLRYALAAGPKHMGFLTLEPSLSVKDAVYIQVISVHPGELSERAACDEAHAFFREATVELGFRIEEEAV